MSSTTENNYRPWGHYDILVEAPNFKTKRIFVLPNGILSYQSHTKREEIWTIVKGIAIVTLEGEDIMMTPGDLIHIPLGAKHRIANGSSDVLVFTEVQLGTYFGEDDIIRYEDAYDRT